MQADKKVLVLEQHQVAGGAMAPADGVPDGYVFDYGVHYIGEVQQRGPVRFFMDQLMEGQVEWAPLEVAYDQVVIGLHEEGEGDEPRRWYPVLQDGHKRWKPLLKRQFPDEHEAIDKYFEMCSEIW